MEQRFNEALGKFEDCEKCSDVLFQPLNWERAYVALGHPEFAALFGTVMRVETEGVMRGQILVAWELSGSPYEQSWHHPHELSVAVRTPA